MFGVGNLGLSAAPSKNAVSANIKHKVVDTSIKRQISVQSTAVVKGCMRIMFDMVDTAFSKEDYWSSANLFMNLSR